MNTYSQKVREENMKYLIPLAITTQISAPNDPGFNVIHDADTLKSLKVESSRNTNRSRTRDRRNRKHKHCQEAKFSDDEDQTTTTSQLSKKKIPNPKSKKLTTFNDLAYYPKGTLLSLKTCSIEMPSKKVVKSDCRVQILTEQEHKSLISEFVDPGFTQLCIKKDKKEADIIQYLSQPNKKAYKYVVCWFEAIDPEENQKLLQIALEANQKKRIFGWHDDHIKLHIMSVRQLSMISKFANPSLFASQAAANVLREERLIMIMQYPQRTYELKELYHPFASISKKEEFKPQTVQAIPKEAKEGEVKVMGVGVPEDEKSDETEVEAEPPKKYWYQLVKIVYQGWDDLPTQLYIDPSQQPPQTQTITASSQITVPTASSQTQTLTSPSQTPIMSSSSSVNNKKIRPLPPSVEKIRQYFDLKFFEAIPSDESDEDEKPDLATELLNELMEFERRQSLAKQALHQEIPHGNQQNSHLFDYYPGQYYHSAECQWNLNPQPQYGYQMQTYNNQYYQYQYKINQEQTQYCMLQGYNQAYNC